MVKTSNKYEISESRLTTNIDRDELERYSQKNPNTTAEGVKIGESSRITPRVMPEKDSNLSSDINLKKRMYKIGYDEAISDLNKVKLGETTNTIVLDKHKLNKLKESKQ